MNKRIAKKLIAISITAVLSGSAAAQTVIFNDAIGAYATNVSVIANPHLGAENDLIWQGNLGWGGVDPISNAITIGTGGVGTDSVGIGMLSSASANQSVTIGAGAITGFGATGSVVVGQSASTAAGITGAVAIGQGSAATASNTVSFGNVATGTTRSLTNVSAGVAGTDAANVGQVNASIAAAILGLPPASSIDAIARAAAAAAQVTADGAQSDATRALTGDAHDRIARAAAAAAQTTATSAYTLANTANITANTSIQVAGVALDQSDEALRRLNAGNFYAGSASSPNAVNAVAIGAGAAVKTDGGIAIGKNATAILQNSVAIGSGAVAKSSVAVGTGAQALGTNTTAIGDNALSTGDYAASFGNNANASHLNSVALGNGSKTVADNTVSVGAVGAERQITNVAAGSRGTDAVNYSQLYNTASYFNTRVNDLQDSIQANRKIAAGGSATALAMASGGAVAIAPGETALTGGVGAFDGQGAIAISVAHNFALDRFPEEQERAFIKEVVIHGGLGGAPGAGGVGFSGGFTLKF